MCGCVPVELVVFFMVFVITLEFVVVPLSMILSCMISGCERSTIEKRSGEFMVFLVFQAIVLDLFLFSWAAAGGRQRKTLGLGEEIDKHAFMVFIAMNILLLFFAAGL